MPDRRIIVVAKPFGQLANRILLFSHFIAAAIEHDLQIVNPAFAEYAHLFPATAGDPLCRFPSGRRLPYPRGSRRPILGVTRAASNLLHHLQTSGRDVGLIRLQDGEYVDLNAEPFLGMVGRHRVLLVEDWQFRNADNCDRHQNAIRSFFTPDAGTLERARAPIQGAKGQGRCVVGVHVRRGDYRTYQGGRHFYSHAQYHRIMQALRPELQGRPLTFFVCSNEPVPPDAFPGLDVVVGGGDVMEDLYGLASCDLLIGPPSTFSRWASFYGQVPLRWIMDPGDHPSREGFRADRGLGWGRRVRAWSDRARDQATR